jgi:hypothetical protein
MNNFDINDIVRIETMPKVFSQLEKIGKYIDEQIKDIDELECNEENKQEVKKRRAEINNTLKLLDDRRKEIKTTLLEPYEIFNYKYEEECKNKLLNASEILKEKIDDIENEQKKQKENNLRAFVEEHCKANNVEIPFEKIGLNITLSASEKSLKEQAKAFIERVASEVSLIEQEEYSDELLMEYLKDFNFVNAKTRVLERHKQLDEIQRQKDGKEIADQLAKEIVEKVDEAIEITAPVEIEEAETYQFEVKATKEQIKKLIDFMKELGVEYK